jgi:hypothetical protein
MARTAALVMLLSLAFLLPPMVSAKEPGIYNPDAASPVKLYMHLIDVQDFPINTQEPDDKYTQETSYGLATSTVTCAPDDTPGVNLETPWHTFYGFSSPSYVEYLQQEGGKPRFHPERGISYDAELDTATPFTLYWYLSLKGALLSPDGSPVDPDSIPLPIPNVVVKATMRAGDVISVDDRAYNTGEVIAQGQTIPATLVADQVLPGVPSMTDPAPTTKALGQVNGKWLYEFALPMTIEKPVIPRASGYNIRVDTYMDNPACSSGPDAALMPNLVSIHSSKDHRPRMEFAITNPIRVTTLHPQFVGDDLVVHTGANAAWGNYDVGEPSPYTPGLVDGITVKIDGPSPATSLGLYSLISETNPHYAHQNDVTVVYVWPYKADRAQPGLYTVTFTARNDQGTATAEAVSQFEIGKSTNEAIECDALGCRPTEPEDKDTDRDAPGVGLVAALAALAAVAVGLRRRGAGPGRAP